MSLLNADVEMGPNDLGEDTWDLYQLIEDSFAVDLGDYHDLLEKSVNELADEIALRSNLPEGDACLTSATFYKVRRVLQNVMGCRRDIIRPTTRVADVVPWIDRESRWTLIEVGLGLPLPRLTWPGWLIGMSLLFPLALVLTVRLRLMPGLNWGILFWAWIFLVFLTAKLLNPLARGLPHGCDTIGGLTRELLAQNYATIAKTHGQSTAKELLSSLRQLIATQMMTTIDEVPPDLRIPSGLNIY
jgi:hypothetical protein